MADQSGVESALVGILAGVVYPTGTTGQSVTGSEVQLYRGFPEPQKLNATLSSGGSIVTVYGQGRGVRNVTRYPQGWRLLSLTVVSLDASVVGDTITFSGTCSAGLNAGVLVSGFGYVYPVQATDTPTKVADALAVLIPGASSSGPVLTCSTTPSVTIGTSGTATREMRRQQQLFMVTCWCSTPEQRDTLASAIDGLMAATSFLSLTDGQAAQVVFQDTASSDTGENANLYRRDLTYRIEYATTQTVTDATMIFGVGTLPNSRPFGVQIPADEPF